MGSNRILKGFSQETWGDTGNMMGYKKFQAADAR